MNAREEIEAMIAARGECMAACNVEGMMRFYVEDCELLTVDMRLGGLIDQYAMRHMAVLTREPGGWKFVRSMLSLEGPGRAETEP